MCFLSTTFPNAPPPPSLAILFESLMVFCSIRFRWSPWLFSLINMLSSLARIANRFWGMNKASLLINSLQARCTVMWRLCTVSFSFGKYQHCEIRMIICISFHLIILKLQKSSWYHKVQCQRTQTMPLVIGDLVHTFAFTSLSTTSNLK